MKNILELLKKIVGISDEQPIVQDMSDELKKVRSNMLAMQIFSVIFMFVMLIFTVVFFVDCVTDLYEYTVKPSLGLAKALCIVIPNFILCLSLFVISLLCKNIFMNVNKNGTPFIPQVPKEMKKIAAVIAAMLILSAASKFLFPIVFSRTRYGVRVCYKPRRLGIFKSAPNVKQHFLLRLQTSAGIL